VELYKRESNAKVKERLLLVIRVIDDKEMPAHVAKGGYIGVSLGPRTGFKGIVRKALRDYKTKQTKEWKITTDSFRCICKNKKNVNGKQTRMDYQTSK
jgi:hypothetical protein